MEITIDLDSRTLIVALYNRTRVQRLDAKRGDGTPMAVTFGRNGTAQEIPAGAVLTFICKKTGEYDGGALVLCSEFELAAGPVYNGTPDFNTDELNTALHVDGNVSNDLAYIDLMGEFSWCVPGEKPVSVATFIVRVANDVFRGDEGTPTSLPSPDDYVAARALLYDREQTLTDAQRWQALNNLGITFDDGKLTVKGPDGSLFYTPLMEVTEA